MHLFEKILQLIIDDLIWKIEHNNSTKSVSL